MIWLLQNDQSFNLRDFSEVGGFLLLALSQWGAAKYSAGQTKTRLDNHDVTLEEHREWLKGHSTDLDDLKEFRGNVRGRIEAWESGSERRSKGRGAGA